MAALVAVGFVAAANWFVILRSGILLFFVAPAGNVLLAAGCWAASPLAEHFTGESAGLHKIVSTAACALAIVIDFKLLRMMMPNC